MKRLSRRTLLRGAGGVAIALPFLDAMTAFGQSSPSFPKRFVGIFTPDGTVTSRWRPAAVRSESDFDWGTILSPLGAFRRPDNGQTVSLRQHIIQLDNLTKELGGPGSQHHKGVGCHLTGARLKSCSSGQADCFSGGGGTVFASWANGVSIDREIIYKLGLPTTMAYEFGVQSSGRDVRSTITYGLQNGAVYAIFPKGPVQAWNDIFKSFAPPSPSTPSAPTTPAGPTPEQRLRKRQLLAIDAVKDDYQRLRAQLGATDRQKLEGHLESVNDIEKRLLALQSTGGGTGTGGGTPAPTSSACVKPNAPSQSDAYYRDNARIIETGRLQMDMLVLSLACDLKRVASFMWVDGFHERGYPSLGFSDNHHSLAHADSQDKLTTIGRMFAEQFAYLVWKLSMVPEGDKTLLHNSLVLWGAEMGNGATHSLASSPFLLAGNAGGQLTTGRYLTQSSSIPHTRLLISCLNLMGVPTARFGLSTQNGGNASHEGLLPKLV